MFAAPPARAWAERPVRAWRVSLTFRSDVRRTGTEGREVGALARVMEGVVLVGHNYLAVCGPGWVLLVDVSQARIGQGLCRT